MRRAAAPPKAGTFGVGVVGYGAYFRSMLLPLLKAHPGFSAGLGLRAQRPHASAPRSRTTASRRATTDYRELVADPSVDVVYVATRHDLHYAVARAAVEAGKAVFVEKPMTMTVAEGARAGRGRRPPRRRCSPSASTAASRRTPRGSASCCGRSPRRRRSLYRVNAGALPPEHWLLDPVEGGGRLLGEGVHFFDMLRFLAGAEPVRVRSVSPRGRGARRGDGRDRVRGRLDGLARLHAAPARPGSARSASRCFAGGASFVLDDYRSLEVHGLAKEGLKTRTIEKGQKEQLENFYRALRGEASLGVTAEDGLQATWCAEVAVAGASA